MGGGRQETRCAVRAVTDSGSHSQSAAQIRLFERCTSSAALLVARKHREVQCWLADTYRGVFSDANCGKGVPQHPHATVIQISTCRLESARPATSRSRVAHAAPTPSHSSHFNALASAALHSVPSTDIPCRACTLLRGNASRVPPGDPAGHVSEVVC